MKTPAPEYRRGIALVIVLSLLVLITVMVVGFLVRVGGERTASANYYAAATTRQLADTAVNLVQAQINEATTYGAGINAWASQPGAVRVFDNQGQLAKIYRLYSAPTLVSSVSDASILKDDIPQNDWAGNSAVWVDLNAPVTVSSSGTAGTSGTGTYSVFPILDPRDPVNPGSVSNPSVTGTMPGFTLNSSVPGATNAQPVPMPVQWLYVLQNGKLVAPTASGSNMATVPEASTDNPIVGRIAFWTDDDSTKVNINTANGSFSSRNGEILPAPWETPHFNIWDERLLFSENQPVKGEFQRYPGHPATTDLYGVLNALGVPTTGYPAVISTYAVSPQPKPSGTASGLAKITPYYADDYTSQGGAFRTTASGTLPSINGGVAKKDRLYTSVGELLYDPQRNPILTGTTAAGVAVDPRQQLESGKFFLTAHSRSPEVTLFGTPRISMWPIHATSGTNYRTAYDRLAAFCATTGTGTQAYPYYIQRATARSGTKDYDEISRNQDIYRYLLRLTQQEIPGFGGNFRDKYSQSHERDQIVTEMMDYIRCTNLYDHSVPATNSTFVRYTTNPTGLNGGKAQVVPLKIVENGVTTHGLGRMQTLSEIGIHVICTADGTGPAYQPPVDGGLQVKVSPVWGSADSAAYASNLPEPQFLRKANGNPVGINGIKATATTSGTLAFPANPTLTSTGDYGGPLVPLGPGQRRLQAELLFEFACPTMGFDPMDTAIPPSYQINVNGINGVAVGGVNPFPNRVVAGTGANQNGNGFMTAMSTRTGSIQGTGGVLGFRYLMAYYDKDNGNLRCNGWSGVSPIAAATSPYRYVSNPFTVSVTGATPTMSLGGGFTAEIYVPLTSSSTTKVQTYTVKFPAITNLPVPDLPQAGLTGTMNGPPLTPYSTTASDWWGFDNRIGWSLGGATDRSGYLAKGCVIRSDVTSSGTWSYSNTAFVKLQGFTSQPPMSDVVRTLVVKDGDYRLSSAQENIDASGASSSLFVKGPGYDSIGIKVGNLFRDQGTSFGTVGVDVGGGLVANTNYSNILAPKVPSTISATKQTTWDWDTGLPGDADGAYANKPDEGNTYINGGSSPYYNRESQLGNDISSYFTANRIVASPVMFGSLPTGVMENISWRTLLFRPQKATSRNDPPGPKDYLLLDLFNMPVVEPYAISEPFSTAGKINMNYQIVPFTYINRSTGLRAVLSSEMIARVPKAAAAAQGQYNQNTYYKGMASSGTTSVPGAPPVARLPVDLDQTLKQFETKFSSWGIYKSAAEICDVYLVPKGYSWPDTASADAGWYGDDFALVGDNVREKPYSDIYPRLTTKSNTYTVHFRVQALKNPSTAKPNVWNGATGVITGEYRGSTTIERYLDPGNPNIKDYATDASAPSLDTYYQWRTISNTTFAP